MSAWFSSGFGLAAASVGVVGAGGIVGMVALQGGLGGSEPAPPPEPPTVAAAPAAPPPTPVAEPVAVATPDPDPKAPASEPAAPALPAFDLVRVDPEGNTVIAGRAAAGADVRVMIDGVQASQAVADPGGNFAALFTVPSSATPRVVRLEMTEPGRDPVRSAATVILAPSTEALASVPAAPSDELPKTTSETGALRAPDALEPGELPGGSEAPLAGAAPSSLNAPDTGSARFAIPDAVSGDPVAVAAIDPAAPTAASDLDVATAVASDAAPVTGGRPDALPRQEGPERALAAEVLGSAAPLAPRTGPAQEEIDAAGADLAPLPPPDAAADASVRLSSADTAVTFDDPEGPPGQAGLDTAVATASTVPAPPLGASGPLLPPQGRAEESSVPSDLTVARAPDLPRTRPATPTPDAPEPSADAGEGGDLPSVAATLDLRPNVPETTAPAGAPGAEVAQPAPVQPVAPTVLLADEDGVRVLQPGGIAPVRTQSVVIDTISYTPQGDVALGGRGSGEGFVRVYLNNRPIKTIEIGVDGQWRAPLPEVDTGVYTLRVDEIGTDGQVRSRVETPFKREEPEVVAALDTRPEGAAEDTGVITVQPGNTLWGIATERYGEGLLYVRVFQANRDRIRDPDLIYPGQVFAIPE